MPRAGLEPARPFGPEDFKSSASAIPPPRLVFADPAILLRQEIRDGRVQPSRFPGRVRRKAYTDQSSTGLFRAARFRPPCLWSCGAVTVTQLVVFPLPSLQVIVTVYIRPSAFPIARSLTLHDGRALPANPVRCCRSLSR